MPNAPGAFEGPIERLRRLLGDRLSTAEAVRMAHAEEASHHPAFPPHAVAYPACSADVAAILTICAEAKMPVIPYGAGTSMEGHIAALEGGLTLDLSRMNAILAVSAEDLDCRVEAGVTREQLNRHLRDLGVFFPVDPGADATLGGMTATRASGTTTVRYGTMKDNVLGLTVVTPDGRIARTGGRARKSAAGYDLTSLYVGSEGTLGVITEVQLRLYGLPVAVSAAVCSFETLKGACDTVIQIMQMAVPVARMELLDEVQMAALNGRLGGRYRAAPTLFLEFHGSDAGVREAVETVGAIASGCGGSEFQWAVNTEERNALWKARHQAFWAAKEMRPGAEGWPTDVCVPVSALADCIAETKADLESTGLLGPIVGHVGDGNFHMLILVNTADEEEVRRATALHDRLIHRALALGGTCTGEHGIGHGKIPCLEAEHGDAIPLMRALKMAVDPVNIMNPGKIFPSAGRV